MGWGTKLAAGAAGVALFAGTIVLSSGTGAAACSPGGVDLDQVGKITDSIDGYSGDQLVNAADIMNAATSLGLTAEAQTIAVMAAIAQSRLESADHGTATKPSGLGPFEEPVSWGSAQERLDPTSSAILFYTRLEIVPDWDTKAPSTAANTVEPDIAADGYAADFASAAAVVDGLTNRAGAGACGAHQARDDYPWPTANINALSPLGYEYRNCTDFVAWRLNRDAGITTAPWKFTWAWLTPLGGNAIDWKENWISHGWATSATPLPGAVAWWGKSGGHDGHVAYVQAINPNGTITIEEYNWDGTHGYDTRRINAGAPDVYLYPPPR